MPEGAADIFFPTDFAALSDAYSKVCGRRPTVRRRDSGGHAPAPHVRGLLRARTLPQVMPTSAFMQRYADVAQTRTLTGCVPLPPPAPTEPRNQPTPAAAGTTP